MASATLVFNVIHFLTTKWDETATKVTSENAETYTTANLVRCGLLLNVGHLAIAITSRTSRFNFYRILSSLNNWISTEFSPLLFICCLKVIIRNDFYLFKFLFELRVNIENFICIHIDGLIYTVSWVIRILMVLLAVVVSLLEDIALQITHNHHLFYLLKN